MASAVPANPQSFNRYSYVLNSPVDAIDPTGMFGISPGGSQLGGIGSLQSFSLNGQTSEEPPQTQQPQQSAQSSDATAPAEPQTPTAVKVVVPSPNTLGNVRVGQNYVTGVGSILEFTAQDQNGKPIQNVTTVESVTPQAVNQNPNPVTYPDGRMTDVVGKGFLSQQPLSAQQVVNIIVHVLQTPTPPVTQHHRMVIVSPTSGVYAVATHDRTYTNLDARGNLIPFVNPQTGRSVSNFRISVSPINVVKVPMVMCPRF
jgi:hypothetical protein